MTVVIYGHAVDSYLRRVENSGIEEADKNELARAKSAIVMAIVDPDRIHHEKKDRAQIHIRDETAAVVGVATGPENSYGPYESLSDDLVVPTVYHSSTFANDGNKKSKARVGK